MQALFVALDPGRVHGAQAVCLAQAQYKIRIRTDMTSSPENWEEEIKCTLEGRCTLGTCPIE